MIQITPQHRILVQTQAIDFRKGLDALVGLCISRLKQDPYSGTVFVFRNTKSTAVKILVYDGTGFWLMCKRFSRGILQYWPKDAENQICATTLMVVLNQGQPGKMFNSWRALPSSNNRNVS